MSTRLQVVLSEDELAEIREVAELHRMTVSEWVRQALRDARAGAPRRSASEKLEALRVALTHAAPTSDIEQMNAEIVRGYLAADSDE